MWGSFLSGEIGMEGTTEALLLFKNLLDTLEFHNKIYS